MSTDNIQHPCYNPKLINEIGRIHLPVAPECNMQCNYCNRDFDCANENRPGVCSKVLSPLEAAEYCKNICQNYPEIKVVGVAGPGDPLANLDKVLQTFAFVKEYNPEVSLCLATNALLLPESIDQLLKIGVEFITITINSLKIPVIKEIYDWGFYKGCVYNGDALAELIYNQHLKSLKLLQRTHIKYKVNTVLIKGLNLNDIEEISKLASKNNAISHNIIPMIPVKGSQFYLKRKVEQSELDKIRHISSKHINVMRHCKQCRADAVGLLALE